MYRAATFLLTAILIFGTAYGDEIERPEDLEGMLSLINSDYLDAAPETWTLLTGAELEAFLDHRWFGGLYIEEEPILGQTQSILLLGRRGKRFTSQGLGGRQDKGELDIEDDRYCVWWKGFGKLCYQVMVGDLAGKAVHLITRDNGMKWAGTSGVLGPF